MKKQSWLFMRLQNLPLSLKDFTFIKLANRSFLLYIVR